MPSKVINLGLMLFPLLCLLIATCSECIQIGLLVFRTQEEWATVEWTVSVDIFKSNLLTQLLRQSFEYLLFAGTRVKLKAR